MAITLSGQNNVDKITASDGVIDVISGVNHTGVVTATTFKGDFEGNITGNVTGNINNTTLLFQIGGAEKVRIDSSGNVGVNNTNPAAYGKFVVTGTSNVISLNASSGAASLSFFENGTGRFYIKTLNGSDGLSFVDADNSSERLRIGSTGLLSVGDASNLDSQLTITQAQGDCIRLRSVVTNNTFKYGIIKQEPYNNNALGVQIIGGKSDSGYSEVAIGGGIDGGYAATQIDFYTGATTTTTTGTRRLRINSAGNLVQILDTDAQGFKQTNSNNHYIYNIIDVNRSAADDHILIQQGRWNGKNVAAMKFRAGADTSNKDDGHITFETSSANNQSERVRIDSSGNVNFGAVKSVALPSGTGIQVYNSSAPRIKLVNDTTGNAAGDGFQLYLSGSGVIFDQKESAEMRFYTTGTERTRIDSSGRLLVASTTSRTIWGANPQTQIEKLDSNAALSIIRNSNTNAGPWIALCKSRGTANGAVTIVQDGDSLGSINWFGADGADLASTSAEIRTEIDGTPGNNDLPGRLIFKTTADGASSPTERLRIDASGRLLLGTTTEGHSNADDLTIATSGNTGITLRSGTSNNGNIFFSDATSGAAEYEGMIWYAHGTNSMRFATAQTEVFIITSTGQLQATSAADVRLTLGSSGTAGTNNSVHIRADSADLKFMAASGGSTLFETNGTETLRITSDGKVGINETNPNTNLHVEQDNAHSSTYYLNSDAAILVQNKNSSSTSKTVIKLEGPNSSPSDCAIVYGAGSSTLIFADRQNERFRIDSNGHVIPATNNTYDLGSTAKGWRNVYTNDLNLSNLPATGNDSAGNPYTRPGNDVDGTNGSWTIQEGKDDLYIINRLDGKKYKFNLTEVS